MQPRIGNPAFIVPDALAALQALGAAVGSGGVPAPTINLVLLRASQINGCGVCLEGHLRSAKQAGETDERVGTVADAPSFRTSNTA